MASEYFPTSGRLFGVSHPNTSKSNSGAAEITASQNERSSPIFSKPRPIRARTSTPLATLVIDAEEDFNWIRPHYGTDHSITNMLNLAPFQEIAKSYKAFPAYLLTYPILQNEDTVRRLIRLYRKEECDLGIQLHPWVTPPFNVAVEERANDFAYSFAGNLPPELEQLKLIELRRKFHECFGFLPTTYRAGRYGLGRDTPAVLEALGIEVDTSVAPRTNFSLEGGPDYSEFGFAPFWYGRQQPVLELPLCREIVGWSGTAASSIYKAATRDPLHKLKTSTLSWTRCAERITLSPEGNDVRAMKRLATALRRQGAPILIVSLHSSSLSIGTNPYVRSKADVHHLYDRLSQILTFLTDELRAKFVKLSEVRSHLQTP